MSSMCGTRASPAVALWHMKPMCKDIGRRVEVRRRSFSGVLDGFWMVGGRSVQRESRQSE
jgi:hypothetical protein